MRRALLAALLLTGCATQSTRELPTRVVFFTQDSAALDEPARAVVRESAAVAVANPNLSIRVLGFAGPIGTPAFNTSLSATRARLVADELQADGVPATRISLSARGATPYESSSTESRRVEIRFGQ